MKKILSILFVAFTFPFVIFAQDDIFTASEYEPGIIHRKRDFSISLSTAYLAANTPYNSSLSGGLKMRMFLGERFSFDSGFLIGKEHSQWGLGTIGLPLWMLGMGIIYDEDDAISTEFQKTIIFGIVMLLSAEHMAYHIPVQENMELSPYVSFLRIKQFSNVETHEHPDEYDGGACFSVGLELNHYMKKFVVSPYLDYNIAYSGDFRGFNVGINMGYYFPSKRR